MAAERGIAPLRTMTVIVAVCLLIDAFVHVHLAHDFAHVKTSTMSQADLFYLEAVLAVVAAIALVVRPNRSTAAFAFLVAAGGFVAVVVYRYVDVGTIGPIPNMYDPYWAPFEKGLSAVVEAVGAIVAAAIYPRLGRLPRST